MRFPAGMRMPTHYHTGIVIAHTIKGAWRYLEHDWVSRAGGTVYETAGLVAHARELRRRGGRGLLRDRRRAAVPRRRRRVVARENHLTSMERYLAYCREHGIAPQDLTEYR